MLKKLSLLLISIVTGLALPAQYKVRFIVQEKLAPVHDSIYIAGEFNNWNPGDRKYLLKQVDSVHKSITLILPIGLCEFKFTRGTWLKVQKDQLCSEMENTRVVIHSDTVINANISTWMDECNTAHFREVLKTQQEDTNKVNSLFILAAYEQGLEESIRYAKEGLSLSTRLRFKKGEGFAHRLIGTNYMAVGKYDEARIAFASAVKIQKELEDKAEVAGTYLNIAASYDNEGNLPEAQQNTYEAMKFFENSGDKMGLANAYSSIGDYESMEDDSAALKSYQFALKLYGEVGAGNGTWGVAYASDKIAMIYLKQEKYAEALERDSLALLIYRQLERRYEVANTLLNYGLIFLRRSNHFLATANKEASGLDLERALRNYAEALKISEEQNYDFGIANACAHLGFVYIRLKNTAIARTYIERGLKFFSKTNNHWGLQNSYLGLSRVDSIERRYKQAYNNYKLSILYGDSLDYKEERKKLVQTKMQYAFDKKESVAKAQQDKKDEEVKRIRNQQYLAIAGLAIAVLAVIIIAFIQYRNNRHKQKANSLLQQQKEKVEHTLAELKSTQAQLIQSEKMASLGELTAGIAHEIQNPLNFVNNFSEVNKELLTEMKDEMDKGNINDAKAIANDVIENHEKINHHGKRADAIVKGMLQHSRTSNGQKEPRDINALSDEYLRLAYHGLRAKDKTFNAKIETDFDTSIGKINIIPQDIGRVLVNLINNAFYAASLPSQGGFSDSDNKKIPTVWLSTKKENNKILIMVRDNGPGIPANILDKIFQPFFTTKPTGQGTGLGLSLAYDIVKAHGGELKVETKEGDGAAFIIILPIIS